MSAKIGICTVFLGCCLNLYFLELLVKEDPGCGHLVTFLQFFFISLEGFIFSSQLGTIKPVVPLKEYLIIMIFFFLANVCNNYAFDFNIPMPLHMIFRSGSLITNMIMCVIIQKVSYKFTKYASVILITLGVIICTFVSGQDIKSRQPVSMEPKLTTLVDDFFWWTVGIFLLTFALLVSARMGLLQEDIHIKYGKQPREALFYTHLLSLPFFIFLIPNILEHLNLALKSTLLEVPVIGFTLPSSIIYLMGNTFSQYICIRSVYHLTAECTSLTVTLVLTLRKFMSLIFSVIYFQNAFTVYHWVGTVMVFIGTIIFTDIIPKIHNSLIKPAKKVQ